MEITTIYILLKLIELKQLINSIWKSRITKQKIKGGKVVNMSSFGVHDNLELKYSRDSEGKVHIEYMEVYMPFWSEKVPENLQGFIDPNTGIMDVQEMLDAGIIDEAFLQGVGIEFLQRISIQCGLLK